MLLAAHIGVETFLCLKVVGIAHNLLHGYSVLDSNVSNDSKYCTMDHKNSHSDCFLHIEPF
jgi:hypothetical protein